jgi:hypothetical protein
MSVMQARALPLPAGARVPLQLVCTPECGTGRGGASTRTLRGRMGTRRRGGSSRSACGARVQVRVGKGGRAAAAAASGVVAAAARHAACMPRVHWPRWPAAGCSTAALLPAQLDGWGPPTHPAELGAGCATVAELAWVAPLGLLAGVGEGALGPVVRAGTGAPLHLHRPGATGGGGGVDWVRARANRRACTGPQVNAPLPPAPSAGAPP